MTADPGRAVEGAELKNFGFTVGGIFLGLGFLFLLASFFSEEPHTKKTTIFFSAGIFLVAMAAIPAARESDLMRSIHRGWMALGEFLAKYVGRYVGLAIFSLLYGLLFTPFSLAARLFGFDPLGLRKHKRVDSYCHLRDRGLSSNHYEKSFPVENPEDEP